MATFFEIVLLISPGENAEFDPESNRYPFTDFHTQFISNTVLLAEEDLIWMHAPSLSMSASAVQ